MSRARSYCRFLGYSCQSGIEVTRQVRGPIIGVDHVDGNRTLCTCDGLQTRLFPCGTIGECIYLTVGENNIFPPNQHGSRKIHGSEKRLIKLVTDIMDNLNNGLETDASVLNFSKAFDKVNHNKLLLKLAQYGLVTRSYLGFRTS